MENDVVWFMFCLGKNDVIIYINFRWKDFIIFLWYGFIYSMVDMI